MATFTKFNQFVGDLGLKVHNLNADSFKVMLCNTAPVATNSIKSDLTDITAGNGYTAGGTVAASPSYSQTAGVGKFIASDVVFTAAGGSIGPFRYAVLYNDTSASPLKPLIGFWDYGSSITLLTGETFTVDFDGTNGILTLT